MIAVFNGIIQVMQWDKIKCWKDEKKKEKEI